MNAESMWTTATMAREKAFIRDILERAIDFEMRTGRHPSAEDLQRQLHGTETPDAAPRPALSEFTRGD